MSDTIKEIMLQSPGGGDPKVKECVPRLLVPFRDMVWYCLDVFNPKLVTLKIMLIASRIEAGKHLTKSNFLWELVPGWGENEFDPKVPLTISRVVPSKLMVDPPDNPLSLL